MPIVLQSSEEAKKHLLQSSKEVAEKLGTLAKALPAKEANLGHSLSIVGKSLDNLHTQCLSAWAAMDKLEETGTCALKSSLEVHKICDLQQKDLATMAKTINETEALAIEAKADANTALRTAQTSLTAAQDAQLAASQYCLVFKGIPHNPGPERETYRMLMTAFEHTMAQLDLEGKIIPKSLRRITKRRDDLSTRPPHVRVELSSINHRILIFDQLRTLKESGNNCPISVAPDIPRYALKKHNALHKIAQIARERHPTMLSRVSMGNNKWPELQIRDSTDSWVKIPDPLFEESRVEYNRRQREMDDRKKAMKRLKSDNAMEVEGAAKAARSARSQNPRVPSASTPAATRGKTSK